MCYKGRFPKVQMRYKGFKMKLRTLAHRDKWNHAYNPLIQAPPSQSSKVGKSSTLLLKENHKGGQS